MTEHSVAFIGTGPDPDNPDWGVSAAMAYRHADAFRTNDACTPVACVDIVHDHAVAFAERYDIDHVYEEYAAMLTEVKPDIVSVCTPVPTHADIVVDCAESRAVKAIHCEKPMADTWGDCRRMAAVCERNGVQLTFNHQRRFSTAYRTAREIISDGDIGSVTRFEVGGKNLFDFGSHLIDLCNGLNGENPPAWTLCQVDYRTENVRYGTHNENQALAIWQYENGRSALLSTGSNSDVVDCYVRIRGTDGRIDLWADEGRTPLRVRRTGEETAGTIACPQSSPMIEGAIDDVVESLNTGHQSSLAADNALRANEIIYGCWESARRRGRVELPLDIEDNPLKAMVDAGEVSPSSGEKRM